MGMRYAGIFARYQNSSSFESHQQRQEMVKNLFVALQSDDVSASQNAFSALQNQGLPINSPLATIGHAIQAGDLAGAQKQAQTIISARGIHRDGVRAYA